MVYLRFKANNQQATIKVAHKFKHTRLSSTLGHGLDMLARHVKGRCSQEAAKWLFNAHSRFWPRQGNNNNNNSSSSSNNNNNSQSNMQLYKNQTEKMEKK